MEKSTRLLLVLLAVLGTGVALYLVTEPTNTTGGYRITNEAVYFFDEPLYEVDIRSFEPLPYDYASDKNFVYYDGRVVPGADPKTFTVLGAIMAKDATAVYVYDRAEPLLDPARVEFLGNYYTKQDNEIHYKGRPTDIDAETIEIIPVSLGAQDKNGIYIAGRLRNSFTEDTSSE